MMMTIGAEGERGGKKQLAQDEITRNAEGKAELNKGLGAINMQKFEAPRTLTIIYRKFLEFLEFDVQIRCLWRFDIYRVPFSFF